MYRTNTVFGSLGHLTRMLRGGNDEQTALLKFLGRENTGKTAILTAIELMVLTLHLNSGLCLDVLDASGDTISATALNGRMKRLRKRLFDLSPQGQGLVSTVKAEPICYALTDGGVPRIRLNTSEEVGQLISGVDDQSSEDDKQRLRQFQTGIAHADVVAIVLSPPIKESDPSTCPRWLMDKKQYAVNLQEAIRNSNRKTPLSVAVLLNKVDTLCPTEQTAREQLSDDLLCAEVQDLIHVLQRNALIENAALFPVSAFGFGKTEIRAKQPRETDNGDSGRGPAVWQRTARSEEHAYEVRKGESIDPFNVKTVLLWSLLASMMHREVDCVDGEEIPLATVCGKLMGDLRDCDGWFVTLKGDLC